MKTLTIILAIISVVLSVTSIVMHLLVLRVRRQAWMHAKKIEKTLKELEEGKTAKSFDQFLEDLEK